MTNPQSISNAAREALIREDRRPLALTDWRDAVFLHFAVDLALLQPAVPFELDLWEGSAYVSVVAFDQLHFRLDAGRGLAAPLTWPFRNYRFCNLRTYVRHRGEPGVVFLVEWISNLPSVLLARAIYGLPYRYVRSRYEHDLVAGVYTGTVELDRSRLVIQAQIDYNADLTLAPPDSVDAFCLERYLGFTTGRGKPVSFRIWHPSWHQHRIQAEVREDSLLRAFGGDWYPRARLVAANYSPGINGVWIARPHTTE